MERKAGCLLSKVYRNIYSEEARKNKIKAVIMAIAMSFIIIITAFLSINMGRAYISANDVLSIIAGKITGINGIFSYVKETNVAIVWDIRLPRILCAILVGGGLAVSGTIFQSVLMNPLADSYTMGVSTGAALGASIAIFINIMNFGFSIPISVAAFSGAILTLFIVMSLSKVKGYLSPVNLILSGIIVSSIFSAAITLIKNAAGENVSAIVGWMMGSLSSTQWDDIILITPIILISVVISFCFSNKLNILSIGDDEARYLGVDPQKLRLILLIASSLITAVCVAVSGIIGFVGLIVPHMLRLFLGADNRKLIPLSMLLGGELLLASDTIARTILSREIPVGVITTLLGGPFFLYIFISKNRGR